VVGLKAVNCQSGDTLAQEQATATAKEKILNALGEVTSKLRGELGESLASVQKFDASLEQATTTSLDALKAYSAGMTVMHQRGCLAAIPFFQHAIELDPNFAMAYSLLGGCYGDISKPEIGDNYSRKAFELRDRTSEPEKFLLSTDYYSGVTGQVHKAAEIGELWAQTYPDDPRPHRFLGVNYIWLGQFDKALSQTIVALQKEPIDLDGQTNLGFAYLSLNRFDDAKSVADKMRLMAPDVPRYFVYCLSFIRGDNREMQHQLALAGAEKEDSEGLASAVSDTAAYYGRIEQERVFTTLTTSDSEPAAIAQLKRALWEAEFRLRDSARRDATDALIKTPTRYVRILAALVLARAGDTGAAERLTTELEREYPPDSLMRLYGASSIRAAIALNRNNPAQTINILQATANVELSRDYFFYGATMYPVYLRGLAYLALHKGHDAAAEFQRIIEHRGLMANCPLGTLAHLQLGRAYAMYGDDAKAKAEYQDFLTLWKDADPDIPILKQAKAEYARLQ
jgi:eukaryotic-like serine/threonine-protein kinase